MPIEHIVVGKIDFRKILTVSTALMMMYFYFLKNNLNLI